MDRFTCDWIFKRLVVLCDGTVVCGCGDPYGERPLGRLDERTLPEIWNSPEVQEIRSGLNEGFSPFCVRCGVKRPLAPGEPAPRAGVVQEVLPRLFLEPTVLCNLSCAGAVCSKDSPILKSRRRLLFPPEDLPGLLAPVGGRMVRLDFFNYGDPFCHPRAVDMLELVKSSYPNIYLYVSTNGLLLDDAKIERLVRAGVDEVTFSVDGSDARAYAKYRRGGDFAKVLRIMRRFMEIRDASGRDAPFVNWRYILFRWNDSRRAMARARRLARRVGVDRLTWEITDHPADAYSLKFAPGGKAWRRIRPEIWDTSQIGSAIRGRRFLARFRDAPRSIETKPRTAATVVVTVKNVGGAAWPERTATGRRLVRLGAQLYTPSGERLELDYARAFLPRTVRGGETVRVEITLPPVERPGAYRLKWDMVSEGVDWFENGGSPVAWSEFVIKG